jgi:ABC-type Fe3+/spermidine/putrescine transport system ATPase subunit
MQTEGRVELGGRDLTRVSTHKRDLGMVFQGYALFPHMTVFENVAFGLRLRGTRGTSLRERVARALAMVDLPGKEDRRPAELSGGQQQRVALARAVVTDPPLLLMDEPLSALDKALRSQMQVELRHIHRNLGTTLLYVTHDQEEALSLSDRIVVMNDGRIAQTGRPAEVYETPRSRFVAKFLGDANFVEIDDVAGAGSRAHGTSVGGVRIVGREGAPIAGAERATVVLRPEDAVVGGADPATHNCLPVRVQELVYLGDRIRCVGRFADGGECVFWVDHATRSRVVVGDETTVSWPCDRSVVVT